MIYGSRISAIAALGKNRELGGANELLWHIPEDLKHFKVVTDGHPVIMGRKTWESLPERARPLPNRTNIVITRQPDYVVQGAMVVPSLEEALEKGRQAHGGEEVFIIGGAQIYTEAIPLTDRLYLTLIDDSKAADVYFPEYESLFTKIVEEEQHTTDAGLSYSWVTLEKP